MAERQGIWRNRNPKLKRSSPDCDGGRRGRLQSREREREREKENER
jgi:hypothetical protein